MRLGEEAGLEHRLALLHRSLDVHGAHEAILGDAEGNLHEGSLTDAGHELALRIAAELLAKAILPAVGILRVRVADGAVDDLDGGQERVQTAGHDGLGGTAPAGDGDTAQCRIDGAEQKRRLDVLLADDRGEGERLADTRGFNRTVPISLHLRSLGDALGDDVGVGHGGANDGSGPLHHANWTRAEVGGAGAMHLGAARCGCDRGWERVGVSPEVHGAREEASERAEGAIRGAMECERDGHVSSRRSNVSAPATTAPARARRAAQPHGAGTQDVGWIDNTTISHAGAHGARFGGACGICRAHSPAKGTGVATADDMAAACMLLSQTRATTGGRRSLQWYTRRSYLE